ncbi:MAG: hypothetical protein QGH46_02010 [Gammaproteobacteria bacterium]|nr:hypothetical protein [Gammaproteobacteria bacterium]MDP7093160.1 hypothetical protein [Gammaproteobacteria bacterium]MDP7271945.1 hypothetical protein [Gammaproteobacteria bacterium]
MMNTHRFVVISMLATGGLHSAFATDASATDAAATDAAADRPFWVLQGGLQIDDKDSYMVNGGLSYMPNAQTYAALDFGFSDSSAGMEDFETNFASLRLDHSFGPLGGSISMGWFGEADIVDRFSYSGSIYLEARGFRLEILGEDWTNHFDTFEYSRTIVPESSLLPLVQSASVNCELDNTAYGGHLSYTRNEWYVYAAATSYDYSRPDCEYTRVLGGLDLRKPPDLMARFSKASSRRLAVLTASQVHNTDAVFLDNSYSVGLSFRFGEKSLTFDYFHSEEVLEQFSADTVLGSVLFPVGYWGDLRVHLGATDHDLSDTVTFIGVTVYWYVDGGT